MMKIMYRSLKWLLPGLLICLLLLEASCGKQGEPPSGAPGSVTDGGTAEPSAPAEPLELVAGGKSSFRIVYARSASLSVTRAAERLSAWFEEYGVEVPTESDGGNFNQNIPADTYEILLGSTNRAESRAVAEKELPECGYLWRVSGRRLVIQASDDALLEAAAANLFGAYQRELEEGSLTLDGELSVTVDCAAREREGWLLHGIPDYAGGELAFSLYDCGYGMRDFSDDPEHNSQMQMVYNTTPEEYAAYLERLAQEGYEQTFENRIGNILCSAWRKCNVRLYVYHTEGDRETRVIWDKGSTVDPDGFSYTYVPAENDTSMFYAYAIYQGEYGLDGSNCGQLDVIKLADNSLFIIDGGMAAQFDQAAQEGFVEFAHKVTGVPEGEKIRIACWYFTHADSDHRAGLAKVMTSVKYQQSFELERMAFNYLNAELDGSGGIPEMLEALSAAYPNCEMIKLHTGMELNLASLKMEVLYTHEDYVLHNGQSRITDANDGSTILKLTMEDVSCLILGDINQGGEKVLVSQMLEELLRVDVVQVAHHTWNWLDSIYDIAQAEYAVFTQSVGGSNRTLGVNAVAVLEKVQEYAPPENCYFSGVETSGLLFRDGTVTLTETYPLAWDSPDYEWKFVYEGVDLSTVPDYSKP